MALTLMKGSEAIAEAAIRAGARYFFGYPITPQTEIPEYMSARMPEVGGCFLQAESEVAAINMIYGAAGAGADQNMGTNQAHLTPSLILPRRWCTRSPRGR